MQSFYVYVAIDTKFLIIIRLLLDYDNKLLTAWGSWNGRGFGGCGLCPYFPF